MADRAIKARFDLDLADDLGGGLSDLGVVAVAHVQAEHISAGIVQSARINFRSRSEAGPRVATILTLRSRLMHGTPRSVFSLAWRLIAGNVSA